MSYTRVIKEAVRRKWHTPEEKEAWYTKFSAARRMRTRKLSEAQNHRCAFCGVKTYLDDNDYQKGMNRKSDFATLEHVVPQEQGGTDSPANGVMSCHSCNNKRGTMDAWKFYELRNDPERWLAWLKRKKTLACQFPKKLSSKHRAKFEYRIYCMAVCWVLSPEYAKLMQEVLAGIEEARVAFEAVKLKSRKVQKWQEEYDAALENVS